MKKILFLIIPIFYLVFIINYESVGAITCVDGEINYGNFCSSVSGLTYEDIQRSSGVCSNSSGICAATYPDGKLGFFGLSQNTPIYGIRISVIDENGNRPTDFSKPINFWATNEMYNKIYTQELRGSFTTLSEFSVNYVEDYDGSSFEIFASDDFNDTNSEIKYSNIFERLLDANVIGQIYDNYINCKSPSQECTRRRTDINFYELKEHNYNLLVEPIFVFRATSGNTLNDVHWYYGTAYEIAKTIKNDVDAGKLSQSFNGALECGNGSYGWGGEFNVIDNFLKAMFIKDTTSGIVGVGNSISGCKVPALLQNKKLGWSKGIIQTDLYTIPDNPTSVSLTIQKLDSLGNSYNGKAYFRIFAGLKGTILKSQSGKDNWGLSNEISFSNLSPNTTYTIKEYTDDTYTTVVTDFKYSIDGGVEVDASLNEGKITFKTTDNTDVKIVVKNPNDILTCDSKLESIKSSSDSVYTKLERLKQLHNEYKKYNKLLNFKLNGPSLDLSNVSCDSFNRCSPTPGHYDGSLSCFHDLGNMSNNISESSERLCYLNKTYYDINDLNAYCRTEYTLKNFKFTSDSIEAGQILWWSSETNPKVMGEISLHIICEGFNSKTSPPKLKYNHINKYIPTMKLKTGFLSDMNLLVKPTNQSDEITPTAFSCEGDNCYYIWDGNYSFNIYLNNFWYSKGLSGVLISENIYNSLTDKDGYSNFGTGVPISFDESSGEKNASLTMTINKNGFYKVCIYYVKNNILEEECEEGKCGTSEPNPDPTPDPDPNSSTPVSKKFNLQFRIIDTGNPFPGINGSENSFRYTGSNWCMSANIGKIRVDDAGHEYRVGDVNGDGIINQSDWQVTSEVFMSSIASDVDGNGTTYNSSNCAESKSDSCILVRYTQSNQNQNCIGNYKKNTIVERYIENRPNSSSNTPMYSITLTPADISEIRKYNKDHAYNEFNMKCENQNEKCTSNFISDWMDGKIEGLNSNSFDLNAWCMNDRILNKKWCDNMEVTE